MAAVAGLGETLNKSWPNLVKLAFKPIISSRLPAKRKKRRLGGMGKRWHWLAEKFKEGGIAIERVLAEDFGWMVLISPKPFLLWVACGNTDGSTNDWTVFPVAEIPLLQRIFKRLNPIEEINKLTVYLREVVPTIPGVKNITYE